MQFYENWLAGYVKFEEEGYLQARSYDDVYGEVYCGWSPEIFQIPITKSRILVRLTRCLVGYGELDKSYWNQIYEVCWFSQKSKKGKIIFSSRSSPSIPVPISKLYKLSDLSQIKHFDEDFSRELLFALIKDQELEQAKKVLLLSSDLLAQQRGHRDMKTNETISNEKSYQDEWVMLLSFKLGFELGTNEFSSTYDHLKSVIDPKSWHGIYNPSYEDFTESLSLYSYLNGLLLGSPKVLPNKMSDTYSIIGQPSQIKNFLEGTLKEADFLKKAKPSYFFFAGVKRFVAGDYSLANQYLKQYLESKPVRDDVGSFQSVGSAVLLKRLKKKLD